MQTCALVARYLRCKVVLSTIKTLSFHIRGNCSDIGAIADQQTHDVNVIVPQSIVQRNTAKVITDINVKISIKDYFDYRGRTEPGSQMQRSHLRETGGERRMFFFLKRMLTSESFIIGGRCEAAGVRGD